VTERIETINLIRIKLGFPPLEDEEEENEEEEK
jgi:hypothetical protein